MGATNKDENIKSRTRGACIPVGDHVAHNDSTVYEHERVALKVRVRVRVGVRVRRSFRV